jgi:hypothetical protein
VCVCTTVSRPSAVSTPLLRLQFISAVLEWCRPASPAHPVSRPFLCGSGSSPTFQNNLIPLFFCFVFPTPNSAEIQQQQQLQQQQLCVWHNGERCDATSREREREKRDSGKGRANCRRLIKYFRDTRDMSCCRHPPSRSFCLADFNISTTNFPAFGSRTTCSP